MKFDAPAVGAQSGRWFEASKALDVIRAIETHLVASPDEVDESETLLRDLARLEAILKAAEEKGVRFRLSLRY
jgi:hypothetical protein